MSKKIKSEAAAPVATEVNQDMFELGVNLETFYPVTTKFIDNGPASANQAQLEWLNAWAAHDVRLGKATNHHVLTVFPAKSYGTSEDGSVYNRAKLTFQQVLYIERPDVANGQRIFNELAALQKPTSSKQKRQSSDAQETHINARKRRNLNKDGSHGYELKPPVHTSMPSSSQASESATSSVLDLAFSNGTYSGEIGTYTRDRRGDGVFKWTSGLWKGCEYRGPFVDDLKNGEGVMLFKNGDKYTGQFVDDVMAGQGRCEYKSGDVYEGNWKQNEKFGQGRMVWKNGDRYVGSWCPLFTYEKGVFTFANGDLYSGEYHLGRYHGQGKLTRKNGVVMHDGQWDDGEAAIKK